MKKLLIVASLFWLMVSAHAVTLLGGVSQFTDHGDGVWYQEAFPYQLKLRSPSVGIRWDHRLTPSWGVAGGAIHLGRVSSTAVATGIDGYAPGDRGYNAATKACNGDCGYLSHWYGNGSVYGLFGMATYSRGPWSVDAGVLAYKPQWTMHIPDWVGECRDCPPISLTLVNKAKINVGPVVGVRYSTGPWSINAHAWYTKTRGGEPISLYNKFTYTLMLGYTF